MMMTWRRSTKDKLIDFFLIYTPIFLLCASIAYPFYYMLINSFNGIIGRRWEFFWPREFTFENYQTVFRDKGLVLAFGVTTLRAVTGIVLTVFNSGMCAFALRKRDLPFRGIILGLLTIPLFFGGGIIPDYMIYRLYGILDTFWVYILPRIVQFFYVIILIAYFRSLSDDLEDSAHIDGAGYFGIFLRIYLPLSLPVLAVIALFTGVYHWQSWFETVYFTRSDSLRTLSAVLLRVIRYAEAQSLSSEEITTEDDSYMLIKMNVEGVKIATMFVTIAPILMIYPFLQRYFVKGLMIGSLKG